MGVEMVRQNGMIDFDKPQTQTHVPEEPPPRKQGGRKPGQIYVTSVRHAKKELIGIYNELKRGEIDPQVAQARRAILWTWINAHQLNLEEVVLEIRREMATYREFMRQRGVIPTGHEGR